MRKIYGSLIFLLALLLSGCKPLVVSEEETLDIYATFYPIYALTEALTAGIPDTALHCLVQPQDGCLRSYQLSDWDSRLLARTDAVIAGGRGLESFESLLFSLGDAGPAVSAVLYNLELYEGSEESSREDSHLYGVNPHIYMSADGAAQVVESISTSLMALDPRYTQRYADNERAALEKIGALQEAIRAVRDRAEGTPVALMNEALIYVAQDYGLEPVCWIDRESGEGLYGDQLTECLGRLDQSGARAVLIEKQAPAALTEALEASGYAVAAIDIMSTHREEEGFEGYLRAQDENAEAISRALEAIKR